MIGTHAFVINVQCGQIEHLTDTNILFIDREAVSETAMSATGGPTSWPLFSFLSCGFSKKVHLLIVINGPTFLEDIRYVLFTDI